MSYAETIIKIPKTDKAPIIDGQLNESVWSKAYVFDNFKTFKPDYGKKPNRKTIAYIMYDSENIYFAIHAFDNREKIKTSIKKRDNMFDDDWAGIVLDTFNDSQSAYAFLVNPSGIQGDGIMGINGNFKETQDFVWYSAGKIDNKGYTIECKIPLKSLRFPAAKKNIMRIAIIRNITRFSENDSCPPLYPDKGSIISQSLSVEFEGLKYKRVFEILPSFVYQKKDEINEGIMQNSENRTDLGITAKIGISSAITLDTTYNPDFSQVEADAGQVDINLRYDIFYPEKRQFFQEGSEFFKFAGNTEEAPLWAVVHTRRIINPVYGIKFSGKISKKDTVLGLFAKDEISDDNGILNPYYSIFRYRHSLKDDSYIGGFYTSKNQGDYFNRIIGSDGRFRLNDLSVVEYHYFGSFTENSEDNNSNTGHALGLKYSFGNRKVIIDGGIQDISKDFRIDSGFITRTGITRLALFAMYQIYPKSTIIDKIDTFYWSFHIYDKEYKTFETFNLFALRFHLPLQTQLRIEGRLGNEVYKGEKFNISGYGTSLNSQITKEIFLGFSFRKTGKIYYDPAAPYQGYGKSLSVSLGYQPFDKLDTFFSLIYVDFFKKENNEKIYDYSILRNRTTLQINKYLFFRGIFEYNTYRKKFNIDALASFTYIPGTVLYLGYGSVYRKLKWENDEYIDSSEFLQTKKGLFFKVSYLYRF
jgi:hypothetical protein